jgi:DNA-binding transcriptional ArsR family regulator
MNTFCVLVLFVQKKCSKKIFGSGARVKLFHQFLMNQDDEFFIRELTRILDEQINSLRRELTNLEKIGMLKSSERNRRKYYKVNPHFPILAELTSIIRKNNENNDHILKTLSKGASLDILILSGQFIDKEKSDTDMFIVGEIEKDNVKNFLAKEFPDKELKYTIMTREDFLYRVTLKDKFVSNLFAEKENLILKNKLKKDTAELVS